MTTLDGYQRVGGLWLPPAPPAPPAVEPPPCDICRAALERGDVAELIELIRWLYEQPDCEIGGPFCVQIHKHNHDLDISADEATWPDWFREDWPPLDAEKVAELVAKWNEMDELGRTAAATAGWLGPEQAGPALHNDWCRYEENDSTSVTSG